MEPSSESERKTILVVDDDPAVLVVVAAILGHIDYNILDGRERLKGIGKIERVRGPNSGSPFRF